jgi:hypothetical protein
MPDMQPTVKQHGKGKLSQAVSLINAPRRTAECNMDEVWQAVITAEGPGDLIDASRQVVQSMQAARDAVNAEVNRCARAPPRFSEDGSVALITIKSGAQIHPVIASRWCSSLKGKNIRYVMVANTGYLPDRVNFAARIAKHRVRPEEPADVIAMFKEAASREEGLLQEVGQDFARGHAQASGGSVSKAAYERLLNAMGFNADGTGKGSKVAGKRKQPDEQNTPSKQSKTLMNFGFSKKATPSGK